MTSQALGRQAIPEGGECCPRRGLGNPGIAWVWVATAPYPKHGGGWRDLAWPCGSLASSPTIGRRASDPDNHGEFYAAMAPHDDARLREVLWTVYWRGNAQLRERVSLHQ